MTMGTMIASLRREHGMTQAELARQMGVIDKAVSKWERDLSCPDIASVPKLAGVLEVSVEELLQAKAPPAGSGQTLRERIDRIVGLVLKAITVAMGVAVIVLSVLKKVDLYSVSTMLGLGLACAGVSLFGKEKEEL